MKLTRERLDALYSGSNTYVYSDRYNLIYRFLNNAIILGYTYPHDQHKHDITDYIYKLIPSTSTVMPLDKEYYLIKLSGEVNVTRINLDTYNEYIYTDSL